MDRTAEQIERKAKALTLVFTALEILEPIDYSPARIVIDTEAALFHADRVMVLDGRTLGEASKVLKVNHIEDNWRDYGRGPKALVGRIDLQHKLNVLRMRVVHRHPEDGLHPAQIVELGDLFIKWLTDDIHEKENNDK